MYERVRVNTLPGYENVLDVYEVDKYGNVYGTDGIEMKTTVNSSGYLYVRLKIESKRQWKTVLIHRAVALAFVSGKTDELNEVDHKDTDKFNNNFWNLRWTDHFGNMANPVTREKMHGMNGIPCYVYDFRLNFIGYYLSLDEASKNIGVSISGVDIRVLQYYILSKPDLELVLKINRKQKLQSVVITDIFTHKKFYFYSNREARRFFDNKVNITQAIQKNWTVRGKYKVRALNYKKLIGMLDL